MRVRLFRASTKKVIPKDMTLEEVNSLIEVEELKIDYERYVEPVLLWVTESPERIAEALGAEKVVPMGGYIRGILGGEKKRGKQEYAGLVVEHYEERDGLIFIKLVNLSKVYQVPAELMTRYRANVYKLYYVGLVNPFKCRTYKILLSADGEDKLKKFLEMLAKINQEVMTESDAKKLKALIKELKISLDPFNESSHYVVYRRSRAFTACVPEDLNMAVSYDDISYLEFESPEQANYYAAVLNYLAYKVIESGRTFIRHQFSRPTIAIAVAGLSWKDVPEGVRNEIQSLATQLTKKLSWREYPNQKAALMDVVRTSEFGKIITLLDGFVDRERLRVALELVSATGIEEEPED